MSPGLASLSKCFNLPLHLPSGAVAVVATGGHHNCALLTSGAVVCWGYNGDGELGVGSINTVGISPSQMGSNLTLVSFGTGVFMQTILILTYCVC